MNIWKGCKTLIVQLTYALFYFLYYVCAKTFQWTSSTFFSVRLWTLSTFFHSAMNFITFFLIRLTSSPFFLLSRRFVLQSGIRHAGAGFTRHRLRPLDPTLAGRLQVHVPPRHHPQWYEPQQGISSMPLTLSVTVVTVRTTIQNFNLRRDHQNNWYERRAYESVDDKSLSWAIYRKKIWKTELVTEGVKIG